MSTGGNPNSGMAKHIDNALIAYEWHLPSTHLFLLLIALYFWSDNEIKPIKDHKFRQRDMPLGTTHNNKSTVCLTIPQTLTNNEW